MKREKENLHKLNAMMLIAETLSYSDSYTKTLRSELKRLLDRELVGEKERGEIVIMYDTDDIPEHLKTWVLSLDKSVKIDLLKTSLQEDRLSEFIQLSKILLDAPISEGGISTEEIESIRKQYQ
jgi:hypothetical protein